MRSFAECRQALFESVHSSSQQFIFSASSNCKRHGRRLFYCPFTSQSNWSQKTFMGLKSIPASVKYSQPQSKTKPLSILGAAACALAGVALSLPAAAADMPRAALTVGHIPPVVYSAVRRGSTDPSASLIFEFALKPRNGDILQSMLKRVKDPSDALYGHYLTPQQYRDQFGRTPEEINQVIAYAKRHNFSILDVKPNNLFVRVSAKVSDVDAAFGISLTNYASTTPEDLGRVYYAPNQEPTIDSDIAPIILGVMGLNNAAVLHTNSHMTPILSPSMRGVPIDSPHYIAPPPIKANPNIQYYDGYEGLDPTDVQNIYQTAGTIDDKESDGSGQVLGLVEFGTFTYSDISEYEQTYDISGPTIDITSVDGYDLNSEPGASAGEQTLDIDMLLILAPNMSSMQIFENTDQGAANIAGVVQQSTDIFIAMANASTRPNVISDSFSVHEDQISSSDALSEGEALDQLALQGQTVCVASGDDAAHDDETNSTPNLDDPSAQPTVVAVGGTDLQDNYNTDSNGDEYVTYDSETSWYDSKDTQRGKLGTGSGGGVSAIWSIPDFQVNAFSKSVNTQGSTSMRNTPDVSLFGDFDDGGYDVFQTEYKNGEGDGGNWYSSNGTSAATPLWAALLGCVDQFRVVAKLPPLGEANYDIYSLAESSQYSSDFHDITSGTNGYYKAVKGYDNSTGWGSPNNGLELVYDLAQEPSYVGWHLTTSSSSVTSGKTLTGTITLPLPASQSDKFSLSSSNTSAFTVPSSVTVAKGSQTATFTITAATVTKQTTATLKASFFGYSVGDSITVNPATASGPGLKSILISPTSTVGGSAATTANRVYLTADATANTTVTLKSSNTAVATVPSTLIIDSGSSSHTFTITTKTVTSSTNVTITATLNGVSETGTLTVTPAAAAGLKSVTLDPTSTVGGSAATTANRVYWSSDAPANETVTLKSSNTAVATVPSSVTISSGSSSHTFTITTKAVTSSTNVTITATSGGVTQTAILTVTPASTAVAVSKVSLSPSSVTGGDNSTGTVTLTAKAPSGGTVVTLKTSNTSSSNVSSSVTVAAGATTATFTVKTASVFSDTTATISATAGGVTKTATLTINS